MGSTRANWVDDQFLLRILSLVAGVSEEELLPELNQIIFESHELQASDDGAPDDQADDEVRLDHHSKQGDGDLPPMSNLYDIFDDMADKAQGAGIEHCLKHLNDRSLRIVTMCSGTEAPIWALQLLKEGESCTITCCRYQRG